MTIFEDVRVGDRVRLTAENGDTAEFVVETASKSGVESKKNAFWATDNWTVEILDRPYTLPTKPGVYTVATRTDEIPNKRVFMLGVYMNGTWTEGRTNDAYDGQTVQQFLLEKKWPLKRLVIEE